MEPIVYKGKRFISYQQAANFLGMTATGFSKRYQKYQSGQFSLAELFNSVGKKNTITET
ncbi:hypothetical protein GQR93_15075 (plasmid) [Lentilactobacillus hilgardii]|uniref:Nuclease-associated modular DNA-binding 1 domain-containing protein n=1 Tax=Lentilactobacillus hilgardii TaxID=1588 RepID=A0A6P1E8A8_LENHI|nr:hypothetical protein [Lentilactobacillus hilgardii]QHB53567.1 hypothetical protein GQR93_15075 [Lentilactobacillus hilgardii]